MTYKAKADNDTSVPLDESDDAECTDDNPSAEESSETDTEHPFSDDPEETATVLTFDLTSDDIQTQKEEHEESVVTITDPALIDEVTDKVGDDAADDTQADHKAEDMTIVVGQEPEKAHLKDDGALEAYDPKKDLEFYKYPTVVLL